MGHNLAWIALALFYLAIILVGWLAMEILPYIFNTHYEGIPA